jgi:hypothetical protein
MKKVLSLGALISAVTLHAMPEYILTARDMRNQDYPQPATKRGKFKKRNKVNSKG